MSILITGLEMPKENAICVVIFPDGEVTSQFGVPHLGTAAPVLPHGRLGDLDELYSRLERWYQTSKRAFSESEVIYIRAMLAGIKETPTIIPVESPKEET